MNQTVLANTVRIIVKAYLARNGREWNPRCEWAILELERQNTFQNWEAEA